MVWMHKTVEEMDAEGGGAWLPRGEGDGRWPPDPHDLVQGLSSLSRRTEVWTGEAAPRWLKVITGPDEKTIATSALFPFWGCC